MILSEVDLINVARTRLGSASQSTVSQQVVSIQLDIDTKNYLGTNKKFANVVFNVVDVNGVDTWAYEGYALSDTRSVPVLLNLPTLAILYDEWRSQGNNGAFIDFLNSLQGNQGNTGWTPILSQVPLTGGKVVVRLTSFVGGEGTLPSELANKIGKYQKADGTFTLDVNEAQDIAAELKAIVEQNTEAVEGLAAEADEDRVAAQAAATTATNKAAEALASANNAATANTNAQSAKTSAETAATNAANANITAQTAKTAAETAATNANTKAAEALNRANQSAASAASSSAVALGVSTGRNSIAPSILLDFANTQQLDSRLVFSRASTATYFDRTGILRTAPANMPRFGFDPVTGESLGLLIEESRTNYIKNSTMSGAAVGSTFPSFWNVEQPLGGSTTTTVNSVGIENGLNYVEIRSQGTSNGTNHLLITPDYGDIIVGANLSVTASIWFKPINGFLGKQFFITLLYYDASSNVISVSGSNVLDVNTTSLTRLSITSTTPAATARVKIRFSVQNTSTGAVENVLFRIAAPQFEIGGSATSWIQTSNSTVTRGNDVCYFSTALMQQSIKSNQGTWFAEWDKIIKPYARVIGGHYSGTNGDFTLIGIGGNLNQFPSWDRVTGFETFVAVSSNRFNRGVYTYNLSNSTQTSVINAGQVKTIASFSNLLPSVICIGSLGGTNDFLNSHIKKVAYYPVQLLNTEIQELTSLKLAGANSNQLPSCGDLGSAAFMHLRSIMGMKARSEINYHGTGVQVGYTIRRPYSFTLAVVNSNGSTTTTLPTANADGTYTADTNYTLLHNASIGTTLTLEIIPVLY